MSDQLFDTYHALMPMYALQMQLSAGLRNFEQKYGCIAVGEPIWAQNAYFCKLHVQSLYVGLPIMF